MQMSANATPPNARKMQSKRLQKRGFRFFFFAADDLAFNSFAIYSRPAVEASAEE